MAGEPPCLAVRGSRGLCLQVNNEAHCQLMINQNLQAPPEFNIHQKFPHDESKSVKVMAFSTDGQMMAWSNMASVKVAQMGEEGGKWTIKFELQQPKV